MIIIGIIVGLAAGYFMATTVLKKSIEAKSLQIVKDAEAEGEVIKKDKILQAKEKFLQLKSEHETHINEKNQAIQVGENKIKQK